MRLLKTILIPFSIFLISCNAPKKPMVEMCHIDYANDECICGLTGGSTRLYRETLDYCDKATSFRPEEWSKVKTYIDELEIFIREGCK